METIKQSKILLVEDNPMHRQMYELQFLQAGFSAFTSVATGEAALAAMEQEKPDLVLLDIQLGGMDGLEILRTLKGSEKWKDIPVLMLSNMREKDKGEEARKLGAADYILKAGALPREVVQRVERFLASKNVVGSR